MTTAIVLAGGIGSRMGANIPKQFIKVCGKPIIVYTLEKIQAHPLIDQIVVVCIEGWEEEVLAYRAVYGLSKLWKVVPGGRTALDSIKAGVNALNCEDEDIIVVHDGVRPLVDPDSISNVIIDCKEYGGAISSVPLVEHVFFVGKERTDLHYIPRENAFRTVTPQAYLYKKVVRAFKKSEETGIGKDSPFIGTLMMDLGEKVCLSKGSEKNIKITDPTDFVFFKSEFE